MMLYEILGSETLSLKKSEPDFLFPWALDFEISLYPAMAGSQEWQTGAWNKNLRLKATGPF
jgi:hypothetical protein